MMMMMMQIVDGALSQCIVATLVHSLCAGATRRWSVPFFPTANTISTQSIRRGVQGGLSLEYAGERLGLLWMFITIEGQGREERKGERKATRSYRTEKVARTQ